MCENQKTYNELLLELQVLKQENESLTIRFDRDIFRHYIEEESLMISESRYRRLFESAKDGILILDAETGKIVDVNQFLIDLLGYSKEKFVEKEIWEIGFFKDVVANIDKFQELQEKEYVRYENLPLETSTGRKINVEFVSNVYLENKKKVIQCNIRDITVRKHHEEELHKLSMAVQQSPASVIITDVNGYVEFANAKALAITGYEPAELIGQNSRIFGSGEMPGHEYKKLWDTITTGEEWRGEFHNKKKNGELFWESATISPIVNAKGIITNYMAIKEDITENKKILDELIMAKEKAEEMNRVKSSFFSNMSHELRTPLIGVLGFSEILEESLLNNKDLCRMASTIRVSGQRLMRTLNFILDIAKLESNKTQIFLQRTNIVPALREVADLFASVASQKNLVYSFASTQDEILCTIDRGLFANIFDNLLNNAVKFTEDGLVKLNIYTTCENAIIEVTDTGLGISVEEQNIIWEEFRQASEGMGRQYEGTGLGLTIAKKYTELMGGTISVAGALGVGTTFTVSFPLSAHGTIEDLEPVNATIIGQTIKQPGRALNSILYVEDDKVAISFVSILLKGLYLLDTAQTGKTALEMVQKKQYEVILMDINLKHGMNGMEITQIIRTMPGYKDIPIFACTAYAMESEVKDFLSHGLTHHLSKPFTKQELLSELAKVLK